MLEHCCCLDLRLHRLGSQLGGSHGWSVSFEEAILSTARLLGWDVGEATYKPGEILLQQWLATAALERFWRSGKGFAQRRRWGSWPVRAGR